jgi:hypothetical protein
MAADVVSASDIDVVVVGELDFDRLERPLGRPSSTPVPRFSDSPADQAPRHPSTT